VAALVGQHYLPEFTSKPLRVPAGSLQRHQLSRCAPEAAHTVLPFPFEALRLAAVEFAEGILGRKLSADLSHHPTQKGPNRLHAAIPKQFKFSVLLEAHLPPRQRQSRGLWPSCYQIGN